MRHGGDPKGQTRFLAVGGILVDNALGGHLIQLFINLRQTLLGFVRLLIVDQIQELLDFALQFALDCSVADVVFFILTNSLFR